MFVEMQAQQPQTPPVETRLAVAMVVVARTPVPGAKLGYQSCENSDMAGNCTTPCTIDTHYPRG